MGKINQKGFYFVSMKAEESTWEKTVLHSETKVYLGHEKDYSGTMTYHKWSFSVEVRKAVIPYDRISLWLKKWQEAVSKLNKVPKREVKPVHEQVPDGNPLVSTTLIPDDEVLYKIDLGTYKSREVPKELKGFGRNRFGHKGRNLLIYVHGGMGGWKIRDLIGSPGYEGEYVAKKTSYESAEEYSVDIQPIGQKAEDSEIRDFQSVTNVTDPQVYRALCMVEEAFAEERGSREDERYSIRRGGRLCDIFDFSRTGKSESDDPSKGNSDSQTLGEFFPEDLKTND